MGLAYPLGRRHRERDGHVVAEVRGGWSAAYAVVCLDGAPDRDSTHVRSRDTGNPWPPPPLRPTPSHPRSRPSGRPPDAPSSGSPQGATSPRWSRAALDDPDRRTVHRLRPPRRRRSAAAGGRASSTRPSRSRTCRRCCRQRLPCQAVLQLDRDLDPRDGLPGLSPRCRLRVRLDEFRGVTCSSSLSSRCRSFRSRWLSSAARFFGFDSRRPVALRRSAKIPGCSRRVGSRTPSSPCRWPFSCCTASCETPSDIIEAAVSTGRARTLFLRIVLPLSLPAIASFTIFQFCGLERSPSRRFSRPERGHPSPEPCPNRRRVRRTPFCSVRMRSSRSSCRWACSSPCSATSCAAPGGFDEGLRLAADRDRRSA